MSNVAFEDLPAQAFPFTIEFSRVDTNEVVHTIYVPGPGAITVPPLARELGVRVTARIFDAHGNTVDL